MTGTLMDRARRTLEAAALLADRGFHSDAVSRAYYAAFHAARAALFQRGEETHTHRGVITAFSRTFVQTGRAPTEVGRTLGDLHRLRAEADYDDGATVTQEQAREALEVARLFVAAVEALVGSAGAAPDP